MLRDDTGFVPLSDAWIINVANEIHRAMPDNAEEVDEMLQIARAVEQAAYERAAEACRQAADTCVHPDECVEAIEALMQEQPK